ncbi:glycosyltransferase family 2 protein [Bizionia myxarmorum]|uniref:Glycosyltransferase family 2 protein n=1 Tax=Bizionia myxarmorum TaxID=291186 RepID=A0A5D0R7U8_9FLAO|nr:glycosyltransferase family 2 protein [Bizionia myxarmorum]TYB77005.1 glycosyltransferase family 2 protein [Bizionia myxarmorum]
MKLSVIIPVFNGANFINKAYNAIVAQELYRYEYEILFIDNNSTDNSIKIIKELQGQDSKVKFFTEKLQGAAAARNAGIDNACGDYLYMFDVDDDIYPNALRKMIHVLDSHITVDAVFGKMVKSNKGINDTIKPNDETDAIIFKETPYWGIHWFTSLKNVVGPPAFLYRKRAFDKIGNYNVELKIGQDTALDIKLGMTCNIAFLDTYIYLYYKHQASSIQKAKKHQNIIFHTWTRLVKEHLPFCLKADVPIEFKEILYKGLFSSMGKLIVYTNGFENRRTIRNKVLNDVRPLEVPFYMRWYLTLLAYVPLTSLLKFYVYYYSRWYVDKLLKKDLKL